MILNLREILDKETKGSNVELIDGDLLSEDEIQRLLVRINELIEKEKIDIHV